ncbi:hypothetical protein LZ31DRAFT_366255 [Colletotrichum somersetense]|nr:hypothetical protein LZ31DRAFT_366255 [Colletotrichum somersetense]
MSPSPVGFCGWWWCCAALRCAIHIPSSQTPSTRQASKQASLDLTGSPLARLLRPGYPNRLPPDIDFCHRKAGDRRWFASSPRREAKVHTMPPLPSPTRLPLRKACEALRGGGLLGIGTVPYSGPCVDICCFASTSREGWWF